MPIARIKENHRPWVVRHAEFVQTDLYQNYHECLRAEREEIIMRGKKSRDPHILSMLEGFDQAASFFQRAVDALREQNKDKQEDENESDEND